jgi:hypothetical protein
MVVKTISEAIEKIIDLRRRWHYINTAGFKRNYDTQDVKNTLCRLVRESKNDDISQILQDAESKICQILQDTEDDKLTKLKNASIEEWAEYLQENHCDTVDEMYAYFPMELFSSKDDEDKWFKRWRKAEYLENWGDTDIFTDSEDESSDCKTHDPFKNARWTTNIGKEVMKEINTQNKCDNCNYEIISNNKYKQCKKCNSISKLNHLEECYGLDYEAIIKRMGKTHKRMNNKRIVNGKVF